MSRKPYRSPVEWFKPTIDMDEQEAWMLGEELIGADFKMLQRVSVVAGPFAGTCGTLICIYALLSEPAYHLETDEGDDAVVFQSQIRPEPHF